MKEIIDIRQPLLGVLMKQYQLSLDEIKNKVANVNDKNKPTQIVCEQVNKMITDGVYTLM